MKRIIPIIAVAALLVLAGCTQTQNGSDQNTGNNNEETGTNKIAIAGFAFAPSTLTIKKGETVTWRNSDAAGHTVTSDSGTELDSQILNSSDVYSHKFSTAGTYAYHCSPHPNMKGTVIVTE